MNTEPAEKLITRNRVGALLRIFANSQEVLGCQIESALTSARKLHEMEINGKKVFSRIDFLVSNDDRYDDSDVADTTTSLRSAIENEFPQDNRISVLDIKQGDIFCMLLNYGIVNQLEDRVHYSFIISHTSHNYITKENVCNMLNAMKDKARVSGLELNLLSELIRQGRVANTFTVWHNKSLMTVGGFDTRASKPRKDAACNLATGTCSISDNPSLNGNRQYHIAGCEEIIPLIKMINNFGPCIKTVTPTNKSLEWGPTENTDRKAYERHLDKISTKNKRQEHFANLMNVSAEYIKKGLM